MTNRFMYKLVAMIFSPFEEVLLLDSDNIPLQVSVAALTPLPGVCHSIRYTDRTATGCLLHSLPGGVYCTHSRTVPAAGCHKFNRVLRLYKITHVKSGVVCQTNPTRGTLRSSSSRSCTPPRDRCCGWTSGRAPAPPTARPSSVGPCTRGIQLDPQLESAWFQPLEHEI
jgi:hypothetical protein